MSLLFALILAWQLVGSADSPHVVLDRQSFLSGRIQLLVPKAFSRLSPSSLRRDYPPDRRPTLVLSNAERTVNVAVTHATTPLLPNELSVAHAAFEQMVRELYPSAAWQRSEEVTVNGRRFFAVDVRTASPTRIRTLMLGTSLERRFLLVSFSCLEPLESSWIPIGERMLQSIRVAPRADDSDPLPG